MVMAGGSGNTGTTTGGSGGTTANARDLPNFTSNSQGQQGQGQGQSQGRLARGRRAGEEVDGRRHNEEPRL